MTRPSAWDVAGAVVWTVWAVLFWWTLYRQRIGEWTADTALRGFLLATATFLAAVYCWARLLGARG